jgi:Tfp pilus assembly protein PilO
MKSSNRLIVSILVIAALAVAFFVLALNPKRQEASELSAEANQLSLSLAESRSKVAEAVEARHDFPVDYQQLVVLGQAVPPIDDTSSLLVELNQISKRSNVRFESIQLSAGSGESLPPAPATVTPAPAAPTEGTPGAVPASATVPPTEAAASLMPLGATIGTAGLGVMPYTLRFSGSFFDIADFIGGLDSLVHTRKRDVAVDGRLVTINGFALNAGGGTGFPELNASFSVTTYLTPPSQGLTAGATPTEPAPSVATPASTSPPAASESAESTEVSTPR